MRQTGIELLAADLGTTPAGLAIAIGVIGAVIIAVVFACWKLSVVPEELRPQPGPCPPMRPRPGGKGSKAA